MTIKFKRNYPIIVLLIAFLSLLAFTMGNQPITSPTVYDWRLN